MRQSLYSAGNVAAAILCITIVKKVGGKGTPRNKFENVRVKTSPIALTQTSLSVDKKSTRSPKI